MKTITFLIFTLGLSMLTEPAYKDHITISEDNIKVVFDNDLTFNDLVAIKMQLEQNEVNITYNNINFDALGNLQSIDYHIVAEGSHDVETMDKTSTRNTNIILDRL